MFNYKVTLQAMRNERASMQSELDKLDQAISALQAVVDKAAPTKTKRRLSIKSRTQISQAQKKEGANADEKKIGTGSKISAQGRRNIVQAQKRRWAKVRAASKAKAKSALAKKALEPPATK